MNKEDMEELTGEVARNFGCSPESMTSIVPQEPQEINKNHALYEPEAG